MKVKALVVDDSKVMRLMVIRSLNKIANVEWEFTEANDGAEALNHYVNGTYDMAFIDWNMPNMTGIEFVRHIRELGGNEHVPLVMVTSEKTVAKIEEALSNAGANAYICKPFTEDEVNQKVSPLLEQINQFKNKSNGSFLSRLFT